MALRGNGVYCSGRLEGGWAVRMAYGDLCA